MILVTGRVPENVLANAIEGKVARLFSACDALAVRPPAAATYEGQMFARWIGQPDAPRTVTEACVAAADPRHAWAAA